MHNHSLISASGHTHAKIVALGLAVSLVFIAMISASGVTRSDGSARSYGPVVKATTTTTVAGASATMR
jgi:hypothetical protein